MTVDVSKTYDFNPTAGSIILSAYARIQIRRTSLEQSHMRDGINELNYLQSKMSNLQPNLWTVELVASPLTQGVATYTVSAQTVQILDAYIRFSDLPDRLIFPVSRTEYASYPNKTQQGTPSVFWFDRLIAPQITLWTVPDGNGPYTLYYYSVRQIQDAVLANGKTVEVPYRWLDALVAGLAHRLSRIYAQQLEQLRKMDADEAWAIAATQDTENVPLVVAPGLQGYFR